MKHPTLQKVSLTTIALVASLALSAQADKPRPTSVRQSKQLITKQAESQPERNHLGATARSARTDNRHLPPYSVTATYQIDDGIAEDAVGFGNGAQNFESLWFNQFTVIPGSDTIQSVEIAWGLASFPQPIDGTPVTVAIWSDPNGDGNPSDAVLLGSVAGTIQNSGTDTFVTYTFSTPIALPAGATSFFAGDLTPQNSGPEFFFQSIDESSFHRQSWIAAMSSGAPVDLNNPGNNDFIGLIDDFGIPGNWLIRANATGGGGGGGTLWYNGDFDGVDGLTNEDNTSLGSGFFSHIYDDFNVNDATGWDVSAVFSDNLADTNITGATFEIRTGLSAGNGGTIVASGTTVTPIVTATGRSGFGFIEFMVEIDGLSVHLDPGTYHLNVTPVGDLTGRSFDSTTAGANCVGTPCGDNDNAFLDSNFFGANFEPVADFGSQFHDFSMGIIGEVSGGGGGITQTSAVSRKHHGNAGDFDITLPGVECRVGNGGTFLQMIVFTFSEPVTSISGTTTTTCGTVNSTTISGSTVTVELGHVNCDGSDITVTVPGVNGASSSVDASATMTLRTGDVNADGSVNTTDLNQIRMEVGRGLVTGSNFRDDINVDGKVNHGDTTLEKTKL
jgi:hypothetical protein